jgi:hypothetical protein
VNQGAHSGCSGRQRQGGLSNSQGGNKTGGTHATTGGLHQDNLSETSHVKLNDSSDEEDADDDIDLEDDADLDEVESSIKDDEDN